MNARSNSNARLTIHRLQVAQELHQFIEDQVLPGTGIDSARFWAGFDAIVADLAPKNRALLAERDRLQAELDAWHLAHPGPIADMPAYRAFLEQIGYLLPQPEAQVTTANVDAELATQAGPQLVVPITNARYALNAANARWGSLYDALYGTDAIPETDGAQKGKGYNPVRGAKVIAFARDFLDQSTPLAAGSHHDATGYAVANGALQVSLKDGSVTGLKDAAQLAGYQGDAAAPKSLLFKHNGIHFDLIIDRSTAIGSSDAAGVSDLVMEAALSTILDLEDSVAAVDAEVPSDPSRRYLTGLSQGGHGTLRLATALSWRFAAIAPVCGWGDPMRVALALRKTPTWLFHGTQDLIVPASCSVSVADCMTGEVSPSIVRPRLTLYPGVGHDSWTDAYAEPELPGWFLSHRLAET